MGSRPSLVRGTVQLLSTTSAFNGTDGEAIQHKPSPLAIKSLPPSGVFSFPSSNFPLPPLCRNIQTRTNIPAPRSSSSTSLGLLRNPSIRDQLGCQELTKSLSDSSNLAGNTSRTGSTGCIADAFLSATFPSLGNWRRWPCSRRLERKTNPQSALGAQSH